MALQYIESSTPARAWTIYTDSKSGLEALRSVPVSDCLAPTVRDAIRIYHSAVVKGHDIILQWIPGHSGIPGNDATDAAALRAHQCSPGRSVYFSRFDAKVMLTKVCQKLSEALWFSGTVQASLLYSIDPGLSFTVPSTLPGSVETMIHRFRLNVPYSGRLLYKLGKADSPNRPVCGVLDDAQHILVSCTRFADSRQSLEEALARLDDRPFDIGKVLGPRPPPQQKAAVTALVQFIEDSGTAGIF